jgi:receptor protein-tyrosine kinase
MHSTITDAFSGEPLPRTPPHAIGAQPSRSAARSIGDILIDRGRLTPEDAERVARYQHEHNVHFGEAAIRLGYATTTDVEFALSRQFDYPYLIRGESRVDPSVIAAYDPFSPEVEALRALRTRSQLAIVSPEAGDGRSYLSANLAVVFSQLGERTLLIDADMRHPKQHRLFGVDNRAGLSGLLAGRCGLDAIESVASMQNLHLLTSGAVPPNPQELLGRPAFSKMLDRLSVEFDIIIVDTPAGGRHAESFTIASRVGAALMVARQNVSRLSGVRDMAQTLMQSRIALVGSVLNEF